MHGSLLQAHMHKHQRGVASSHCDLRIGENLGAHCPKYGALFRASLGFTEPWANIPIIVVVVVVITVNLVFRWLTSEEFVVVQEELMHVRVEILKGFHGQVSIDLCGNSFQGTGQTSHNGNELKCVNRWQFE
jgi:hypothetical protein